MTAEHSCRNIEATSNLALCKAVDKLGCIVSQVTVFVCDTGEGVWGDSGQVDEKTRDQGGDESSRGSQASLVDICETHTRWRKGRNLFQRLQGSWKVQIRELVFP